MGRSNDLEGGIELGLLGDSVRDGDAKGKVIFARVRGPVKASIEVCYLGRLCLGEGCA